MQVKFALLTNAVNARPVYLTRNVPPRLTEEPLVSFDATLQSAVEPLVGYDLTGSSLALLRLPISDGGCGLRAHAGCESIHAFNQRVELVKPFLSSYYVYIERALSCTGSLPFPSPASNGPDSQVTSLKEVHQHTITGVITQLDAEDPRKAAFVCSGLTQPGDAWNISGKWLTWHGGSDRRLHMEDDTFGTALRFRLALPDHNSDLACPNDRFHGDSAVNLRYSFMHLVRCHPNHFGLATKRHDRIKHLLFALLKDTLVANETILPTADDALEIVVQQATANTREIKADIVVFTNPARQNQARYIFDVAIVEPTNQHGRSAVSGRIRDRGAAAAHKEKAKFDTYRPVANSDASAIIIPFVLESNGFVGTEASKFLTSLVDKGHSGTKKRIQSFLAEVSYGLAKDTGWAATRARIEAVAHSLAPPPAE